MKSKAKKLEHIKIYILLAKRYSDKFKQPTEMCRLISQQI